MDTAAGTSTSGTSASPIRWADLAVAAWSLRYNYGGDWRDEFFDAYGVAPDQERHRLLPSTVGGRRLILQQISVNREKASDTWYFDIPAIAQLAEEPLVLDAPVTVIVGENGSGKSTLLEAVAAAWAARLRGAVTHWTPGAGEEDSDLNWALWLDSEFPRPAGGCFLRAEAMHQLFTRR